MSVVMLVLLVLLLLYSSCSDMFRRPLGVVAVPAQVARHVLLLLPPQANNDDAADAVVVAPGLINEHLGMSWPVMDRPSASRMMQQHCRSTKTSAGARAAVVAVLQAKRAVELDTAIGVDDPAACGFCC